MTRPRAAWLLLLLLLTLPGCALGPAVLKQGRIPYNRVIQETSDEQLLLNLVRLRYGTSPLFLEVGSVSAQYVVSQNGELSGTLNENVPFQPLNPDALTITGGIAVEERPTIVYTPLQGEQFAARLMSPIPLETIALAARTGWRVDRLLRLTVQEVNGLDNAGTASGPTPAAAPDATEFTRAVELLHELQRRRLLLFEDSAAPVDLAEGIAAGSVSLADTLAVVKAGYFLRPAADGASLILAERRPSLSLRVPPAAAAEPELAELRRLLSLRPDLAAYPLRAVSSQALPGGGELDTVRIVPRSLLGAMYYLGHAVEVPPEHRQRGWVTITRDAAGGEFDWVAFLRPLLTIHSARFEPRNAAIATRYLDYWFYVDAADLNSKATLVLLNQLLAVQAGTSVSGGLQLTLPVGG